MSELSQSARPPDDIDYWYRGVVQYNGGPPEGYVATTCETAALKFVWTGNEALRDDPEADCHWVERRPMDCWERVSDAELEALSDA